MNFKGIEEKFNTPSFHKIYQDSQHQKFSSQRKAYSDEK